MEKVFLEGRQELICLSEARKFKGGYFVQDLRRFDCLGSVAILVVQGAVEVFLGAVGDYSSAQSEALLALFKILATLSIKTSITSFTI